MSGQPRRRSAAAYVMFALLAGSIPGVIVGSLVATRSSDSVLRPILAITLLLSSVKLLTA